MSQFPLSDRRVVLLTAVLMFVIILISGGMGVYVLSDSSLRQTISLTRVALEVEAMYPGQLDWDIMFDSAMNNIMKDLDRYSSYVEPQQFESMDEELTGSYGGIGVTVIQHDRGLLIMSVRETGPAHGVGLLAGDVILYADSVSLAPLPIDRASRLLRGKSGSNVLLTVLREVSEDTLTVSITRQQIDLQHIPYAGITAENVMYIRLLDFNAGAASDVRQAIDSLLSRASMKPTGVILDLRGNPGGLLTEAYETAELFLEEGKLIVGTDGRSRWNDTEFRSRDHDLTEGLPMAVIVDRGSASASEIVAGALKQHGRAALVGDTTFGKGLVQGYTRFQDGSGLRLTISRYYLEGGLYLNEFDSTLDDVGHGLAPDYYIKPDERNEFTRRLENSLLLHQFANRYQDEIIENSGSLNLSDSWVGRFEEYAQANGFHFISRITRQAELVQDLSYFEKSNMRTIKSVGRLLRKSKGEDRRQFARFADYIKMRLKQIAYERKYGTHRAYADVITRERPEIRLATQVLLKAGS